jgi:flagellar hook protein FlgE
MLQSFFTGLSGMFSFSKGLDTVSNNIANMNTPGFRGTNNFFQSVHSEGRQGIGTSVSGTSVRDNAGEIRQTGNSTDLAISGNGMFVLRNDQRELFYTRAGQFTLDSNNVLTDAVTGMEVQGISANGALERIDLTEHRILPGVATTKVSFSGNISSTDANYDVSSVTLYDASGNAHELALVFENPDTSTDVWNVDIRDSDGNSLGTGEVRFDNTGSPLTDFNTFDVALNLGGEAQTVTFDFGEPGSFSGATQFSGSTSTLGVSGVDGNGVLGLIGVSFNDTGVMQLKYSNGDTIDGTQIALASFSNQANLEQVSGSLYQANSTVGAEYGRPGENAYGKVQGGSIELSNVDLTQEFADIMIIQRGYQASSRAMSVANELIEQLYNNTRG